ncbi:unnamed protein product [Moneuplotes crassus]|uniref:Uncharacterized protein n=1 Tax=Euplotes crassus TaxID=5936 RepID=A0AAD1U8V3_EUPCR|nr:unnamed protein product [Moneuplotes crassus]
MKKSVNKLPTRNIKVPQGCYGECASSQNQKNNSSLNKTSSDWRDMQKRYKLHKFLQNHSRDDILSHYEYNHTKLKKRLYSSKMSKKKNSGTYIRLKTAMSKNKTFSKDTPFASNFINFDPEKSFKRTSKNYLKNSHYKKSSRLSDAKYKTNMNFNERGFQGFGDPDQSLSQPLLPTSSISIAKILASNNEPVKPEKESNISIMKIQHKELREKAQKFLIQEANYKSASILNPKFESFRGPFDDFGSLDNPGSNIIESNFSFINFNQKISTKKIMNKERIFKAPADRAEEIYQIIKDMNSSIRVKKSCDALKKHKSRLKVSNKRNSLKLMEKRKDYRIRNKLKRGILGQRVRPQNSFQTLQTAGLAFGNSHVDLKINGNNNNSPEHSRNIQVLKLKKKQSDKKGLNSSEWSVRNHSNIPMKSVMTHVKSTPLKKPSGRRIKDKMKTKIKQAYEIHNEFKMFRSLNSSRCDSVKESHSSFVFDRSNSKDPEGNVIEINSDID